MILLATPKKIRPTEDEMKAVLSQAAARYNKVRGYKPPENLADVRKQTPIFMGEILDHGKQRIPGMYTDIDFLSSEINQFFALCREMNSPPNVGLLAMWLGISRDTFNAWENNPDIYPQADTVKKAKAEISAWKTYLMETNQINAVAGIFSQKVDHGAVETQYINLTAQPGQARPEQVSEEDFQRQAEAAARMIESGELKVLPDGKVK